MKMNQGDKRKTIIARIPLLCKVAEIYDRIKIISEDLPVMCNGIRSLEKQIKGLHEKIEKVKINDYKQLGAFFSLFNSLDIKKPLPLITKTRVYPDFSNILVSLIIEKKPSIIVELGSGLSTIISGYALKKAGKGKIISFENEEKWANITKEDIKKHNLGRFCKVILASLKKVRIKNNDWDWYDEKKFDKISKIDLLIVDGPFHGDKGRKDIRYPALPLLYKKLSKNAVILIDDALRKGEKEIIEKWLKEFPDFSYKFIKTEKGICVLRRR